MVDAMFLLMANTVGEAMLLETFRAAAFYVKNSGHEVFATRFQRTFYKEGSGCYAFLQGSGLDIALNRFGLGYDAELLRAGFNYCLRHST